jgi:hypothetical protein
MPKQQKSKSKLKRDPFAGLPLLNLNAAGIDIGSREHYVAVPADRDSQPVRIFKSLRTFPGVRPTYWIANGFKSYTHSDY